MVTQELLKKHLHYNPDTGIFVWIVPTSNRVKVGDIVNSQSKDGIQIGFFSKRYRVHRLAWLYMTGAFPVGEVDHRNGVNTNNQWINLRVVSHAVNMQNIRKAMTGSQSGLLGASRGGRGWRAKIKINGMIKNLGVYDTKEEAHAAYICAKRILHEGCTI